MAKRQGLTPRHRKFVREYLVDLNATQAAIRSGYKPDNAGIVAAKLVRKSYIKNAIREAMEVRAARTESTQDEVIRELRLLCFSNHTHYTINDRGELILTPSAPFGAERAVSSVKHKVRTRVDKDGAETVEHETEIRLWNKNDALKEMARHLGVEQAPLEVILDGLPDDIAKRFRSVLAGQIRDRERKEGD